MLYYCWWLKSCTTWDVWNPMNNGIYYLSTGARFQPSTVVSGIKDRVISPVATCAKSHVSTWPKTMGGFGQQQCHKPARNRSTSSGRGSRGDFWGFHRWRSCSSTGRHGEWLELAPAKNRMASWNTRTFQFPILKGQKMGRTFQGRLFAVGRSPSRAVFNGDGGDLPKHIHRIYFFLPTWKP